MTLRPYLELVRPANVVTAFADVLAGFAAAGAFSRLLAAIQSGAVENLVSLPHLAWLLVSTACLYAGGVVLNDVFDADLDAVERPERPIPSGRVSRSRAGIFGSVLIAIGIVAASSVGLAAFVVAVLIALCAVVYDAAGKHHPIAGPINMGLCRGGNLLLGVSAVPVMLAELWFLAIIPIAYIGAVTAISAGEVHGGTRSTGASAILLVGAVLAALLLLGVRPDYRLVHALPFIGVFALLVFPAFIRAAVDPSPGRLRTAVRTGVISLVAMDAALAAGFGGWTAGIVVLILLPISMIIGRAFSVT